MRAPNVDFQVLLSLIYSPGGQYAEERLVPKRLLYKTLPYRQALSPRARLSLIS